MKESHHPAIISKEEYDAAQITREKREKKIPTEHNMFRGKVKCGFCGTSAKFAINHKRRYYVCSRKSIVGAKYAGCNCKMIPKEYFNSNVLAAIQELVRGD